MNSSTNSSIFGFFASFNGPGQDQDQIKECLWGSGGLKNKLSSLHWQEYGNDFQLILFQFHVNPIEYERANLREIENYRRKEKSIGISIVIDNENYFNLSVIERTAFIKSTISLKLELLCEKVKRSKLNLNLEKLKSDVLHLL